jgi:flagellin
LDNVAVGLNIFGLVEGAYENIMDNLIEMKSLATQASNSVLSTTARQNIGDQIEQLGSDINDLAKSTTYNSVSLLDGTNLAGNLSYTFQTGDGTSDTNSVNLPAVSTGQLFNDGSAGTLQTNITISAVNNGSDPKVRGEFTIASSATAANFSSFITNIDSAITELNGYMNSLGIVQNTFSTKESSLLQSINVHSAVRSNAIDADLAKEQSENIRLQILQKTAVAALAQANLQPGVILSLLK